MRSRSLPELGFVAGLVLMELLPIWMICSVVRASVTSPLPWSFTHCYVLQLSAAVMAWYSRRWQLPRLAQVLLLFVGGVCLVASWLVFSLARDAAGPAQLLFACLIAVYLCARGLLIGLHADATGSVLRWFGIGTVLCVLLFAFLALARVPRVAFPFEQLRICCLAYFALGATLAGLDQRRGKLERSKLSTATSAPALRAVAAPVLLLLGFAVLPAFGLGGTRGLVSQSLSGLHSVTSWLLGALHRLGAGLAQLLLWIGALWEAPGAGAPPLGGCGDNGSAATLERVRETSEHAGHAEALPRLLLALGLICLVYFVLELARGRTRVQATNAAAEEQEERGSTWSWQLLLQPLEQLRRRAQRQRKEVAKADVSAEVRSVREVYRALLAWALAQGERRNASATAQEFAAQLAQKRAKQRDQISQLTEYYTQERYAERACSAAETQAARMLLEEITVAEDVRSP